MNNTNILNLENSSTLTIKTYTVTIVTVSLNAFDTINDTLASVIGQKTSHNIEHLCIDGGSTDGTRELIKRYAQDNPDMRYIFEPDTGLFDAMNKGAQIAKGKYVMFLNADDFLASPTVISNVFSCIRADHSPDLILGRVVMGRLDRFGMMRMRITPRWLPRFPKCGVHPPHQGTFVKSELLRTIGGFDIAARAASDTIAFYKMVRRSPRPSMHITNTIISFMRTGGASNAGLKEYRRGNMETYRLLLSMQTPTTAALSIMTKAVQKIFEIRFKKLYSNNWRWFDKLTKSLTKMP